MVSGLAEGQTLPPAAVSHRCVGPSEIARGRLARKPVILPVLSAAEGTEVKDPGDLSLRSR